MSWQMSTSRPRSWIPAAFAAIYIVWGSTYLAVAVAVQSIPPSLLIGSRSLAGGLILFACAKRGGSPTPLRSWVHAGACGLLFFVGCHGVMAFALQRVPSGMTAIILATIPFWIAIVGFALPARKQASRWTLALLVPGLAGVGLIAWRQLAEGETGAHLQDIALLLGASLSWALGSVLSERHSVGETSAIAVSGMALIVGGVVLLAVAFAAGEVRRFRPGELSAVSALAWTYLVLAGTVVAFGAYVWLLERVSPTLVATYTFVNPIIAVLLGWAVLGETPTPAMLVGGALVVASIAALLVVDAAAPPRRGAAPPEPRSVMTGPQNFSRSRP
jgi:drug/metabolite transporter (DMT)-like permease